MIETLLALMLSISGCVAQDKEVLQWGQPGQGWVTIGPVPTGLAWLVRAAGGFTNDPGSANYMMEVIRPVKSMGGACCWNIPVARSDGPVSGTPVIALERPLVLHEGERLSIRRTGVPTGAIGVNAVYYQVERGCLPLS